MGDDHASGEPERQLKSWLMACAGVVGGLIAGLVCLVVGVAHPLPLLWVGYWLGSMLTLFAGAWLRRRGRLPVWASVPVRRRGEYIAPAARPMRPYTGTADQALLVEWLKRRRARTAARRSG